MRIDKLFLLFVFALGLSRVEGSNELGLEHVDRQAKLTDMGFTSRKKEKSDGFRQFKLIDMPKFPLISKFPLNRMSLFKLPEESVLQIVSGDFRIDSIFMLVSKKYLALKQEHYKNMWQELIKEPDNSPLGHAMDIANELLDEHSSTFNKLNMVYNILAKQLLDLKYEEYESIGIPKKLDLGVYKQMSSDIVDRNLESLWSELVDLGVIKFNDDVNVDLVGKFNVIEIREWLSIDSNKDLLAQIKDIHIEGLTLTYAPLELLCLLTNLERLDLVECLLVSFVLPNQLVKLKSFLACNSQLMMIYVSDKLVGLEDLRLYGNKLKSINIPGEIFNLKELNLDDNMLNSIVIPSTLVNLMFLDIFNNRWLGPVYIPDTFSELKEINIDASQREFVILPDNIRDSVNITVETFPEE